MRTVLILFLVISIILFSCHDDGIYYTLNEESIDYFAPAKDGSWWIFKDTLNNRSDSFYISDYKIYRQFTGAKSKGDSYQGIQYKLNSSDKINRAELQRGWMSEYSSESFNYSSTYSGVLRNYFYNFPSVIRNNDTFAVESCITCGFEICDSLFYGSYKFNNVIKVWRSSDTFYFAPQVGLIRFYENGNEYLLQNYLINK